MFVLSKRAKVKDTCETCAGAGTITRQKFDPYYGGPVMMDEQCPECGGSGKKKEVVEVKEEPKDVEKGWLPRSEHIQYVDYRSQYADRGEDTEEDTASFSRLGGALQRAYQDHIDLEAPEPIELIIGYTLTFEGDYGETEVGPANMIIDGHTLGRFLKSWQDQYPNVFEPATLERAFRDWYPREV